MNDFLVHRRENAKLSQQEAICIPTFISIGDRSVSLTEGLRVKDAQGGFRVGGIAAAPPGHIAKACTALGAKQLEQAVC